MQLRLELCDFALWIANILAISSLPALVAEIVRCVAWCMTGPVRAVSTRLLLIVAASRSRGRASRW
jgi:hypothetical protein